jgi:TonB family protein
MRITPLFCLGLFTWLMIGLQNTTQAQTEEIFLIVEESPSFPGGEDSLKAFIAREIQYPKLAAEAGIQGKVFVNFVVEIDGSISNIKVLRDIGGGCGVEAMRVVGSMPPWNPGKQRQKAVRVSITMPVEFKLNKSSAPASTAMPDTASKPKTIYTVVEVQPSFPGGEEALTEYIVDNIEYPEQARKAGIQGKVYVAFVVEEDGSISNVRVLRDIGGGCGEEAVRVVKLMPRWNPASQKGKPVKVQVSLPVSFILQSEGTGQPKKKNRR